MGSGVSRTVTGAVYGTGAALPVRTVGFRPRRVVLFNSSGIVDGVWQDSMPDASMKKVTGGTTSYATSNGVTPLSDGFSIGADADMNVADELIHWAAHE